MSDPWKRREVIGDGWKPMRGIWTLTAPNGRQWTANSPLECAALEQLERIPASVAMARVIAALDKDAD